MFRKSLLSPLERGGIENEFKAIMGSVLQCWGWDWRDLEEGREEEGENLKL